MSEELLDQIATLMEELAQLGVRCTAETGQLKISAAKGVFTVDLQRRVAASRDEIIRRLQAVDPAGPAARIVPDPLDDALPFPLSDLQLGFYIADDAYMEFHVRPHCYIELEHEDFDVAAYEGAWNKALKRHRREVCIVNQDIQMQILGVDPELKIPVNDLRGRPLDEVRARLLAVRQEMERQQLPLDRWPWLDIRVSLWEEDGRQRARVHSNHNTFFGDGFGSTQLLHEVDDYYADPTATRPPLTLSYRDAILGLERLAQSEKGAEARSYWFSRLPSMPPPPALPQKRGLDRRCRSRLERRDGVLAKPLWDAFRRHAAALGVTPSNAIIAAYAYVIAAWSNSDRFIFSQMVTRRFAELHPDLMQMMGNFASLYPLEVELAPSATFVENAKRIQSRVLEDTKHLQLGGMRVLQELNRLQGSFGSAPSPFVVGSGLSIKRFKKASYTLLETSQTILDHQFFDLEDGSCYYVWDLMEDFFTDGVIDAMWAAYEGLLHRLAADQTAWTRTDLELLSDGDLAERRERNRTEGPFPTAGLHDALAGQAERRGAVAVVTPQGTLSYGALQSCAEALAGELAALGVRKGELVPVVMDRGEESFIAVMGILMAGAAYVPVDPRLPAERLALLLRDVRAVVALTQDNYAEALPWPDGVAPLVVSRRNLERSAAAAPDVPTSGTDLAYVIYTSGSTGMPKGVVIDHRGALNTVLDVNGRFGVGPADRLFGVSAFNFDLSVYDIFGALAAGAAVVYPDPAAALDPTHWLDLMQRERITIWNSVPALMKLLAETAERHGVVLPELRLVLLSGDRIPLDLPDAIRRVAPNATLISMGGATEASIWSIIYPIGEVDPSWSTIPYGFPMVNQTWHVLDRNGRPCPTWVPGELYIGGIGLAQGYWNDAEKTNARFAVAPHTGERLYRTGDSGRYMPGACIEWMGRVDFQVKLQGHRIELGEIEAALGEHPAVAQSVVVLQPLPHPRLIGHIVPAEEGFQPRELEAFLRRKLPAHMIPTAWRMHARLPLTHNGKIDRKALAALPLDPDVSPRAARESVAPGNVMERRFKEIWETILGVGGIGVTDDFFELGGQSFDAIRIFALIKDEFARTFTLGDIWQARTIRNLAAAIEGGEAAAQRRVVPIDAGGSGAPLFLVHPAGGSVMTYSRLGSLLDRPLFGLQANPALDDSRRRRDIVELARHYLAEIRAQQPHGPYSVGGWSSGAMIAFEIAAQLEAAGQKVDQLLILDGPAPVRHDRLGDEQLLLWFLEDLALGLPLDRLSGERFDGLPLQEQLRRASALLGDGNGGPVDLEPLLSTFEIFRDIIVAGTRYEPATIAADLTVVRVEQDVVDEFSTHPDCDAADWGWSRFATGNVRCLRVPGTHHTFLKEPLVDDWYELLGAVEAAPVARG